jgi:hypothetical protein
MRQRVILERDDLETLHRGGMLTIGLGDGQRVEIWLEEIMNDRRGMYRRGPRRKTLPTKQRQGLSIMRADCPYCDSKGVLIASHVRRSHPGKIIPLAGEGYDCPHCPQRFPTLRGVIRHIQRSHKGKPRVDPSKLKKTAAPPRKPKKEPTTT